MMLFTKDAFFRNNFIFFSGSIAVATLNYLYHPLLGRLLSVEEFGEVQALISFLTFAGIIIGVFGIIGLNIYANQGETNPEKVKTLKNLYSLSAIMSLLVSAAVLFFGTSIARAFNFSSVLPLIPFVLALLTGVPLTFQRSYFQAENQFGVVSYAGIIVAGGKLLLAAVFVLAGLSTFGAIGGLAVAQVLALLYAYSKREGGFSILPSVLGVGIDDDIKKELKYGLIVFSAMGLTAFLYTADIVFVRYFFPPDVSGLYSGVAAISRIIFFATGSIAAVLLPAIKINAEPSENRAALKKSFLLFLLIGGGGLLAMLFAPRLIISILIGEKFLQFAPYLRPLAFVIFLISAQNLLAMYFMALRSRYIFPIALSGILITSILAIFFHGSIPQIIYSFMSGAAFALLSFTLLLFFESRENGQ